MMKLNVVGAQIYTAKNMGANLSAILRALEFNTSREADILLTSKGHLLYHAHIIHYRKVKEILI